MTRDDVIAALERELAAAKAERCPNLATSDEGIRFCSLLNAELLKIEADQLKAENAKLMASLRRFVMWADGLGAAWSSLAEQESDTLKAARRALSGEGE